VLRANAGGSEPIESSRESAIPEGPHSGDAHRASLLARLRHWRTVTRRHSSRNVTRDVTALVRGPGRGGLKMRWPLLALVDGAATVFMRASNTTAFLANTATYLVNPASVYLHHATSAHEIYEGIQNRELETPKAELRKQAPPPTATLEP
jgi:hypothetical protein